MSSAIDKNTCQFIYQNLLACLHEKHIPASVYIREFYETSGCDSVVNFKPAREKLAARLNKGDPRSLQRILQFQENSADEKMAAQVYLHYATWHHQQLVSALSWPNWLAYHTVNRGERVLVGLGIGAGGGGYAGISTAVASWRWIHSRSNK